MSKYNKLAKDPKYADLTQQWLEKRAPLTYFWGPTGVGKTHLFGSLLKHVTEDGRRPYAPVYYIDAEDSSETIASHVDTEELCTLRRFDRRADQMLDWFYDELEAAEHAKCGAIVLEGCTKLFRMLLTPEMRKLNKIAGSEAWQAHNDPAQRMDTVFGAVEVLQINRRAEGCAVPIFVSLNTRKVQVKGGAPDAKVYQPDFSDNRINAAKRSCTAFIELPSRGRMLCEPTPDMEFRKMRSNVVARAVESATNLTLPGLLTCWAVNYAMQRGKLSKELAAELPDANPSQDEPS